MQDGNHVIARIADSHMPTIIVESEVRPRLSSIFCGIDDGTSRFSDRDHAVGPRTDVDPCTQNLGL